MEPRTTILRQVLQLISRYDFEKHVRMHQGDKWVKDFSTRSLLNVMLFSVLTGKKSMRHAVQSLSSIKSLWYHMGLSSLSRNNVSHALMTRSCAIFEDYFHALLDKTSEAGVWLRDKRFKFKAPLRAIDSTTITLGLNLSGWAKYRKTRSGIKLHFEIDTTTALDAMAYSGGDVPKKWLREEAPAITARAKAREEIQQLLKPAAKAILALLRVQL